MSGESNARLTLSVGKREFEDLTSAWAAYLDATQSTRGLVDPVLAMQRTGTVLRALKAVFATLGGESEKVEEDPGGS